MTTNTAVVGAMIHGRRADSTRRRQRVLSALDNAITDGAELSVTSIARRALLTELKRESPHVNEDVAVSGVTVTARDRRW